MTGGRVIAVWLGLATLAVMSTCVPSAPAEGQQTSGPAIAIGALGTSIGGQGARHALRDALANELSTLRGVRLAESRRARFVVRGAFTKLERRQVEETVQVDCAVSLIVSDAQGNVRMMLEGRAGARGGGDLSDVERTAVQAAVRGALRPLPRNLR